MLSEIKKQNVKNMFDLLKNAAENFCDKTFIKWQEEEEILEKSFLEMIHSYQFLNSCINPINAH